MTHVSILLCTRHRRTELQRCCASLRSLRFRRGVAPTLDLVVVDNSDGATPGLSSARVSGIAGIPARVLHEPRVGIPFARNTALDHRHPDARFVAFVDDDETVAPSWLEHLLEVAGRYAADLVTGPALVRLPDEVDPGVARWFAMRRSGRADTGTELPAAATNNLLVSTSLIDRAGLRFDESIGLGGGSDTDFTTRARAAGGSIVWADRAVVWEYVTAERATWRSIASTARKDGATRERYAHRLGNDHGVVAAARRATSALRSGVRLTEPYARRAVCIDALADMTGRLGALAGHTPSYYRSVGTTG